MPTGSVIVDGLSRIANEFLPLAVLWHVAVAVALAALAGGGWRPQKRVAAALLALPLLSASIAAWATGNPFNGILLAGVALALLIPAARMPRGPVHRGPSWAVAVGSATIAFAWVYPHFLAAEPAWLYLFAAPMGLVPCPTLALVIGCGLLAGGFRSRAWSFAAALAGLFYSLFGMFRLGVWLDAGLFFASSAVLVVTVGRRDSGETFAASSTREPTSSLP